MPSVAKTLACLLGMHGFQERVGNMIFYALAFLFWQVKNFIIKILNFTQSEKLLIVTQVRLKCLMVLYTTMLDQHCG